MEVLNKCNKALSRCDRVIGQQRKLIQKQKNIIESQDERVADLQQELKPSIWDNPFLWIGAGMATGVVISQGVGL